ncbi:MAG: 30S ribosomal protein S20 [Clostridia bacterium]|nr:30S ribosomal protein S20 [Clostridia bacterium]MBQ3092172.1 30S ribosomal protein S20 [Clostridia bacterium]MBQ9925095.1 30S ribosomal protein S20 [Clostridia bacterium]
MPNIKSAKKRVLVSKLQNEKNRAAKSALKTQLKKFDAALEVGGEAAKEAFNATNKAIDKAVAQGILHKNAAARKKSQVAGKLNSAQ